MNRKWFCVLALLTTAILCLNVSSCAHSRQLVGITIQPSAFTFLTPNPQAVANFTALGAYIHPPETREITSEVTWSTNVPQIITVTAGAVSPTGAGCGEVTLMASDTHGTGPSGNLVIGQATVTVKDPTNPNCP